MSRVALLCPDLLFGSKVEGALRAAGHEVTRYEPGATADAIVVDLTGGEVPPVEGGPVLGFYSHVDQETRRRAEEAGYDRVVPRSRMAREAPALVEALIG